MISESELKIHSILEEELHCLQELHRQASSKIAQFLKKDLSAIENGLEREQVLHARFQSLNQRLSGLLNGLPLSRFLSSIDSSRRGQIELQIGELAELLRKLALLNQRNSRYLETSKASIQSLLQQVLPDGSSYSSQGYLRIGSSRLGSKEIRT